MQERAPQADMVETATITIHEYPIKTAGGEIIAAELLEAQGKQARVCLVRVDYRRRRGTCVDERYRKVLRNGDPVEPRPSVPGGPDIYGLAIQELTGSFENDESSAEERLASTKKELNDGGIFSGGHDGCAANGSFLAWMKLIVENPEDMKRYAESQLGPAYQEELADKVVESAAVVVNGGRYDKWDEKALGRVLGDEAGEAIEVLGDVSHEAKTLVRNWIEGTTVDQTELYNRSVVGKGSFVQDDPYADMIEHVLSSGPDAVAKKQLAEHVREFILAAVANAVPNPELYQLDLTAGML